MNVLKGIVKVTIAIIGAGAAGELGKRGLKNIKDSMPSGTPKQ
jgi:hypothetical protein